MTNERWLKWAIARYYRSIGYRVSMKPVKVGNAMIDGMAIGPEGDRIGIEVKSPADDIVRGIGQCYEALAAGYGRVVLVTTLRVARKLKKRVFQRRGMRCLHPVRKIFECLVDSYRHVRRTSRDDRWAVACDVA